MQQMTDAEYEALHEIGAKARACKAALERQHAVWNRVYASVPELRDAGQPVDVAIVELVDVVQKYETLLLDRLSHAGAARAAGQAEAT